MIESAIRDSRTRVKRMRLCSRDSFCIRCINRSTTQYAYHSSCLLHWEPRFQILLYQTMMYNHLCRIWYLGLSVSVFGNNAQARMIAMQPPRIRTTTARARNLVYDRWLRVEFTQCVLIDCALFDSCNSVMCQYYSTPERLRTEDEHKIGASENTR
jgi:hypothetical protein